MDELACHEQAHHATKALAINDIVYDRVKQILMVYAGFDGGGGKNQVIVFPVLFTKPLPKCGYVFCAFRFADPIINSHGRHHYASKKEEKGPVGPALFEQIKSAIVNDP